MSKADVYEDVEVTQGVLPFIGMSGRDVRDILLSGAGVGAFVAALYLLLNNFVFSAVLCRPQQDTQCADAPQYAMIVATVIGAIAGLVTLARVRAYRPLFIVLFATIAIWFGGIPVASYAWYWILLVLLGLYAVAYLLFAWLARLRSFLLATIVSILVLVLVRLVATS